MGFSFRTALAILIPCDVAVRNIRKALDRDKPICGICMGNQLLAKAGGASIYKLKYGHRKP